MIENNNMLFKLREAARICPDVLLRKILKDVADLLQEALALLASDPTASALQTVNGLWAKGVRVIDMVPTPRHGGRAGALREGARLAA